MNVALTETEHNHSAKCPNSSPSIFQNETFLKVMNVLEKISLVALAAFALYTAPHFFIPYFAIGFVLGVAMFWDPKRTACPHAKGTSIGCSQGFFEQLTGIQLPAPLGLAVNAAIAYCHIDHHTKIFVPIIGLNAGMYAGKLFGEYVPKLYRNLSARCC